MCHSVQICFVVYLLHLSIYDVANVVSLSFFYLWPLHWSWLVLIYSFSFWFSQFPPTDRFTHGEQAWRNGGGLGMAFEFQPWNSIHTSWCQYYWSSCSHDLDSFGILGSNDYTQWPRHYDANGHILSSTSTCRTFPDTGLLNFQRSSSHAFLSTSGSPNSLQHLHSLQQHQGVIHWRDTDLGNFQMSWSRTLFLRSLRQLGVVFANCRLLAPSFWDSSITRAQSFSQCPHWDDLLSRWNESSGVMQCRLCVPCFSQIDWQVGGLNRSE